MKKRAILALLVTALAGASLASCGKVTVTQTATQLNIEAGEDFTINMNDHFEKSDGKEITAEDYTMDATSVDTRTPGTYDMTVTFGKDTYTIGVVVADTTAPEVSLNESTVTDGYICTNTLDIAYDEYVTAEDRTATTLSGTYVKVQEAEVMSEEVLTSVMEKTADDALDTDGDGYYRYDVTAEDESGNTAEISFYAVYDATLPEIRFGEQVLSDGDTITVEAPAETADAAKALFTVTDNMTGDFASGDFEVTVDGEKITVTAADRCGNANTITVTQEVKKAASENSTSGNSAGNTGTGGNKGSSSTSAGNSNSSTGSNSESASAGSTGTDTPAASSSSDPVLAKYPGLSVEVYTYEGVEHVEYTGTVMLDGGFEYYFNGSTASDIEHCNKMSLNYGKVTWDEKLDDWICWASSREECYRLAEEFCNSHGIEHTDCGWLQGCGKQPGYHVNALWIEKADEEGNLSRYWVDSDYSLVPRT